MTKLNEIAANLWSFQGEQLGLNVTVLGGVHGNETVGVDIVNELMAKAISQGVKAGVLNLGIGNPAAYANGVRYLERDLNRCFGFYDTDSESYEAKRAAELKSVLKGSDVLLDLHATIKPSSPMLLVSDMKHRLSGIIGGFGISTVITGPGLLPPNGDPICTDSFVGYHGGLGVTIEAGWLQDPKTLEISKGVMTALMKLGVFHEHEIADSDSNVKLEIWRAVKSVIAGSGFRFKKDWSNFEPLEAGTVFAEEDGGELSVPEDSVILFPKKNIVIGEEACIIAV